MIQWLGLHAFTAGGMGSIPGPGTKVPHAAWQGQKKKEREREEEAMLLLETCRPSTWNSYSESVIIPTS